jgi:serine/threonine protein kinase
LQYVSNGALEGLKLLDQAGIVHNDIKPDNLMWVQVPEPTSAYLEPRMRPSVRIVDFGCARLDSRREEPGQNWALSEGGAGHLGKWPPEMSLRLPITHRADVWGLAVCLCELHCGRNAWRIAADTTEVILAQSIGLCNLRGGVPMSMLRRSPLDIRVLYTPAPRHLPMRRNPMGEFEVLQPTSWGLDQVLGESWDRTAGKHELHDLLKAALVFDPEQRPSAAQLLESCQFASQPDPWRTSP